RSTVFWATSTRFWMLMPMPSPIAASARHTAHSGAPAPARVTADRPGTSRTPPVTRKRFHRPYRVINWPETTDPASETSIIGATKIPAADADSPRANWKYWAKNTEAPNTAMPMTMLAATASTTVRSVAMCSGTSGWRARSWVRTASGISSAMDAPIAAEGADHHANAAPPKVSHTISSDTVAVIASAPR